MINFRRAISSVSLGVALLFAAITVHSASLSMQPMGHSGSMTTSCVAVCSPGIAQDENDLIVEEMNEDDNSQTPQRSSVASGIATASAMHSQRTKHVLALKPPPPGPTYIVLGVFRV